jgi:excisionase family DNA binding protein
MNDLLHKPDPAAPILALRPREAARALGISDRTLWQLTADGVVPFVRLRKAILYPVDALRSWLEQARQQQQAQQEIQVDHQ